MKFSDIPIGGWFCADHFYGVKIGGKCELSEFNAINYWSRYFYRFEDDDIVAEVKIK